MSKQPKIYCICRCDQLTFTCFCYDCKMMVNTPNYVYVCPYESCGSNWVRTEYICSECNRKVMIYDAIYRYWFIDNAMKIPSIFDKREGDENAEKEENAQMQHEDKSTIEIPSSFPLHGVSSPISGKIKSPVMPPATVG
jgi:hypothetical protein